MNDVHMEGLCKTPRYNVTVSLLMETKVALWTPDVFNVTQGLWGILALLSEPNTTSVLLSVQFHHSSTPRHNGFTVARHLWLDYCCFYAFHYIVITLQFLAAGLLTHKCCLLMTYKLVLAKVDVEEQRQKHRCASSLQITILTTSWTRAAPSKAFGPMFM